MAKFQKFFLFPIIFISLILSCTNQQVEPRSMEQSMDRYPNQVSGPNATDVTELISAGTNLPIVLQKSTEVLTTKDGKTPAEFLESDLVSYLQASPEKIALTREQLLEELTAGGFAQKVDPTKHVRLLPIPGTPGYSELNIYVNHPYYKGRSKSKVLNKRGDSKSTNLIKVWGDFIKLAQKEIILNVFDFDLEEIADILITKAKSGLMVKVGVDKGVYEDRPEVKALADRLIENGVQLTIVDAVQLNHQKMTSIDWSIPEKARVLFSSGNLTRSCLNPGGDLNRMDIEKSIPNANHLITMKSWVLSNLVYHELSKTLTQKLRGKFYPLNGSYQVTGPGVKPDTLEAYPNPSITISFSPRGATAIEVDPIKGKSKLQPNINKNLIAQIIKREKGFIRMLQFAYSSADVDSALLFRAQQDFQETKKFDFMSVGDTPFALRDWSRFLKMSGYKLEVTTDAAGKETKKYLLDLENPWVKGLSKDQLKKVQERVYIAPAVYGESSAVVDGKPTKVSSKIHHKVLVTPRFAILGTSFNFSEGAEDNNEQILVIRDDKLPLLVDSMVRYLANQGKKISVVKEAEKRNLRFKNGGTVDEGNSEEKI